MIDGHLLAIPVSWDRIQSGFVEFVYTQANCAGQAYIQNDQLVKGGAVLDDTVYFPGPRIGKVTQVSIGFEKADGTITCSAISQVPVEVGPIKTARLPTFQPPFCVSPTRKECR